jgi:tRNA G10  N-methylase Trm11
MRLIFKLGKNPLLSIAEIYSLMQSKDIKFEVIKANNSIFFINLQSPIYADILIKILGGVLEIFRVEDIIDFKEAKKVKPKYKVNIDNETFAYGDIIAKQDIKDFEKKEIQKPYVEGKNGMVPSKLAKIMVNLAVGTNTTTIYDPYCGTGSILIEALLQGYNVIGTDINPEVIEGCKKNLNWVSKEYGVENKSELFVNNAASLAEQLVREKETIAISTEPYLGSAWSKPVQKNVRNTKTIAHVDKLIISSIRSLSKILKNKERLVIMIPSFKTKHDIIYLKARDMEFGSLKKISIIPEDLIFNDKKVGDIKSFLYYREKAIVRREIFIFEKI